MKYTRSLIVKYAVPCLFILLAPALAPGATAKILPGHVPRLPSGLSPFSALPGTNQLRLAIGLPLRDRAGLDAFLGQLYDPTSTNYQHYLSPEEFTARFGPTAADYQAVMDFAGSNHLAITATHANRIILDVQGSADDIGRAFHIHLLAYHHPTEKRDFYAPDSEPSVDAQLPVADISGLSNYRLPHPLVIKRNATGAGSANGTGSGTSGTYFGNDFRSAYIPGVTLTGLGQTVGLLQFDGFYASDIASYASAAGLPSVPLQTVLLDGYSGTPTTTGNVEVSLDIEMAMSMAPNLSSIVLFEAGPSGLPNDVLSSMAASNQVKQLSCSWSWSGGPTNTTDALFQQMDAQGQSFFCASGDSDAFTSGASSANGVENPGLDRTPCSNPYITLVGGTTLTTTGPGGAWSAEQAWNWGYDTNASPAQYVGTSGGISSYYTIPPWQTGIDMTSNSGSTTLRNIPDVALTGDNVLVDYGNGKNEIVGGTSCAAPLWAALTALINQQAIDAGRTNVGFLNPALYALGKSANYTNCFRDTATGNNTNAVSPTLFYATNGYDLCTGWGTPNGRNLINLLSGVTNSLGVVPGALTASGPVGGAFSPGTLTLTNAGTSSLAWSLINTSSWLSVLPVTSGSLSGASTTSLVNLNVAAKNLAPGIYTTSLLVTNQGNSISVPVSVSIGQNLIANGGFETGDLTGWTFSGDGGTYDLVAGSSSGVTPHSGNYAMYLGDIKLASLSQSPATVSGQSYLISLWMDNPESAANSQIFKLNWNGNTLYSIANPGVLPWTNLQFIVSASGAKSTLQIQAQNNAYYFGVDDVSVTPLPAPVFKSLAVSAGNFQLGFYTATGAVYQVQYNTNLTQSNWFNLGSAFTAANYFFTLQDTNALNNSGNRFYRLQVLP